MKSNTWYFHIEAFSLRCLALDTNVKYVFSQAVEPYDTKGPLLVGISSPGTGVFIKSPDKSVGNGLAIAVMDMPGYRVVERIIDMYFQALTISSISQVCILSVKRSLTVQLLSVLTYINTIFKWPNSIQAERTILA